MNIKVWIVAEIKHLERHTLEDMTGDIFTIKELKEKLKVDNYKVFTEMDYMDYTNNDEIDFENNWVGFTTLTVNSEQEIYSEF